MTTDSELIPLFSSSRGNSTLIKSGGLNILIDCGKSCKQITEALLSCGIYPDDIHAIFLTHGHHDHISGVPVWSRKYHTPIYATSGTLREFKADIPAEINVIEENDIIDMGGCEVRAFPTAHDIDGSVCYAVINKSTGVKLAVMTDLGKFSGGLAGFATGAHAILLESNYDVNMLKYGPYSVSLQRRIRGGHGHISNDEAAQAAEFLITAGTRKFYLGHLSPQNNTPDVARKTFTDYLATRGFAETRDYEVRIAAKDGPTEGYGF